ncbi:MAG: hypothetical protein IPG92_14285 [Flavobacteriales bacterium]|nr:hypothetical protein [Flavobacteriales bacterium]
MQRTAPSIVPRIKVVLEAGANIGHGALSTVHVGRNCLVGMNAVLMDNVVLGECIVALAFLPADSIWERRKVIIR